MGIRDTINRVRNKIEGVVVPRANAAKETINEISKDISGKEVINSRPIISPSSGGSSGFTPVRDVSSGFVSGGGGGGSGNSTPAPTMTPSNSSLPQQIINAITSPALATKENAERARIIRQEAARRGEDISTPARELGFINKINTSNEQNNIQSRNQNMSLANQTLAPFVNQDKTTSRFQNLKQNIARDTQRIKNIYTERKQNAIDRTKRLEERYPTLKEFDDGAKKYYADYKKAENVFFTYAVPTKPLKNAATEASGLIPKKFVYTKAGAELATDFIPTSAIDVGVLYGGYKAFQYAPKIANAAFTGLGIYERTKAETPIEKARANLQIAIPTVAEYGVRRYSGYKLIKDAEAQLKVESPTKFKEYTELKKLAKSFEGTITPKNPIAFEKLSTFEDFPITRKRVAEYLLTNKNEVILGGSLSQTAQIEKTIQARQPKDIDLYVQGFTESRQNKNALRIERELKKLVKENVSKELINQGIPADKALKKAMYVSNKAFDIHTASYLRANIEQVTPFYKPAPFAITKSAEGFNVFKIETQLRRKLVGAYLDKYISGNVRRAAKDIKDIKSLNKSFRLSLSSYTNVFTGEIRQPKGLNNLKSVFNIERPISSGKGRGGKFSNYSYPNYSKQNYYPNPYKNKSVYPPKSKENNLYPQSLKKDIPYPLTPRKKTPNPFRPLRPKQSPYPTFTTSTSFFPTDPENPVIPFPKRSRKNGRTDKKDLFGSDFLKGKKSKTKTRPLPDDIYITQDFTSKVLGLKPIKVRRKDLLKFAERELGIGIRRPVIVVK